MACSSPILPQNTAPLPAAVKTAHSRPVQCRAVHQGKLLGNSAQFWPKALPSCPSLGDKNAKYNVEWKTEVRQGQRAGWDRNRRPELGDRRGLAATMLPALPRCALAWEMWGVDGVSLQGHAECRGALGIGLNPETSLSGFHKNFFNDFNFHWENIKWEEYEISG